MRLRQNDTVSNLLYEYIYFNKYFVFFIRKLDHCVQYLIGIYLHLYKIIYSYYKLINIYVKMWRLN